MREDSCITCGGTMKEFQRCLVCSEIIKSICSQCRRPGDEQIHMNCGMEEEIAVN